MVQTYGEQQHDTLSKSIGAMVGGQHLSRTQRAVRCLMLVAVFLLMALPILIDWFH